MDAETIRQLVLTAPWGVVIIVLHYMNLQAEAKARAERTANAKEKSEFDRQTQVLVSQNYANAINNLVKIMDDSTGRIVTSISEFRSSVSEQYEKMGLTIDLYDMAKEKLAKGGKT